MLAIRGALSDILSASTFARMEREKPELRFTHGSGARPRAPAWSEPECLRAMERLSRRVACGLQLSSQAHQTRRLFGGTPNQLSAFGL